MKLTPLRILFIAMTSGIFISGCGLILKGFDSPENAGTISGNLTGVDVGATVILRSFKNGSLVKVAEGITTENGDFFVTPEVPLERGFHQVIINKRWPLVLITDSTEAPTIQANIPVDNQYLIDALIEGSEESSLLAQFYAVIMPLQDSLLDSQKAISTLSNEQKTEANKAMKMLIAEIDKTSLTFIKENEGHPATLAALEPLKIEKHSAAYKSVLKSLATSFSDSDYYVMLKKKYDASTTARTIPNQPPPKKTTRKNGQYAAGDEALDIVMTDPDGNVRKLSDLRGKVVLLDFWASWCGPCRRENPAVVKAYEKYNSQGFEVFSVSLDSNADKWKNAIEKDGLVWPYHVCDLKGWGNAASRAYGISSIPHALLVGRDGVIIETHLRGRALETELEKLFK
tara:strand:+ start:312 stop:1511 length:1200 start_codon:yes stop_codon:yes gene_type:complete